VETVGSFSASYRLDLGQVAVVQRTLMYIATVSSPSLNKANLIVVNKVEE
jgi:hypothetical protein